MLRDTNEAQEIGSEKEIDMILDVLEKHCTADCFLRSRLPLEKCRQYIFLNAAHPGHDIIVLSTKGNNEKLTKILCYTEMVFSPYYHKMPDTA